MTAVPDLGSQAYTIAANSCFSIADVLVDGVSVGAVSTYTFSTVTVDHTIAASFTANGPYNITASSGPGGAISPAGVTSVSCGASQAYAITANACFVVSDVLVDGVSIGAATSYTFSNVQTTHTIAASFAAAATYSITASADPNGSISPSGAVSVACGADQAFSIAANSCYQIADVLVDGVSVGAVASYNFTNVTANHTIAASFSLIPYTITASSGPNGAISPAGAVVVNCGGSQAFSFIGDPCYIESDVVVDGVSQGPVGSYTFTNVTAPHTISVAWTLATETITASAGPNGTITPAGVTSLSCGGGQAYTITPDGGYSVLDVLVDGGSVGAVTSYTFSNVTSNRTISATFAAGLFNIVATAGAGGSISPSGTIAVSGGSNEAFTISPNAGFAIADVLVDGVSVGAVASYTFLAVSANHTIDASFAQITYTLTVTTTGSGSVVLSPPGGTYNAGTPVTITATASAGSHFDVFSGDASGHTNPVVVTMTANKNVNAAFLANVYSWNQTAGSSSFVTTTNWTPTRWSNSTDDVLQFNAGGTSIATGVVGQTIAQLSVSGGTSVALQAGAASVITIAGAAGTDFDVQSGSTLNLNGTFALQLTMGNAATGTVGGRINVNSAAHRINPPNVANTLVFTSGALCVVGDVGPAFSGNVFGIASLNAVHFQSGSVYAQATGSNPFGAPQPNAVTVFEAGSRYRLESTATNASVTPSMSGRSYADFELNVAAPGLVTAPSGGGACKADNVFITQGHMRWGMTGQFDIKGSITVNPGATLNFTPASAATVTLSGTSPQTITNNGTLTDSTLSTIEVKNATGVVLGSDVTLPGTIKFTTGNITTGANTLSVTGAASSLTGAGAGTGYVVGNLRRTLTVAAGEATRTFDIGDASNYTPVLLAVHGAAGNFDVRGHQATPDHPNLATSGISSTRSVNRYYTLTPSGSPTFSTYDATFNFAAGDVDGGANTSNFLVKRWNGSAWSGTGTGTRTATSTQATGVTSFSDFAIGEASDWTITASAGAGGTISPNGAVVVADNGSQAFTIAANSCFSIADVLVDGVSVGAVASYTFTTVTANHTIAASFAVNGPYTITASAGTGGSISPSGAVVVACGGSQLFTIAPDACNTIQDVLVDGVSVGAVASYTFTTVTANHTIAASFLLTLAATSNALTISPSPSVCQQAISITSTLTPNTATGSVEFFDGATSLGTAAVSTGTAVLSVPGGLSVGAHTLKGVFTPSGCFVASTSPNKAHTVNKATPATALTSNVNPSLWNQPVTFTATVTPATATGTVTFKDSTTVLGTVALSGGTAQFVKSNLYTGNHTRITATYNGDACFNTKASANYAQLVYRAGTTTSLSTDINPSNYGQSVVLTATVSPVGVTNKVFFYDNGNLMGAVNVNSATGLATLSTTNLLPGKHDLTAAYQGDTHYSGSSTVGTYSQVVVVVPDPSSVALTASPSPTTCQTPVTLSATVNPSTATGTVEFFDGATSLGSSSIITGVATIVTGFNVGSHSLHANYGGSIYYLSSTSPSTALSVTKATSAIVITASENPSTWAQPVTLTASVTPNTATGTVTFKDSLQTLAIVPVVGGQAQLTRSNWYTGNHTQLVAIYSGDACLNSKTSSAFSLRVYRADDVVSMTTDINPSTYGQLIRLTAAVTPLGATRKVFFYDGASLIGTADLNSATGLASLTTDNLLPGKHELFVTYQGDRNFKPSSALSTVSQVVNAVVTATSLASDINPTKFGQAVTLTATISPNNGTGSVEFFDGATSIGVSPRVGNTATLVTSVLVTGSHSLTAVYSGDAGHLGSASAAITQNVTADQPPVVAVQFPNGGENIVVGGDTKLTWNATDNTAVASVTLDVSRDFGATWTPIATNIANTGTYVWRVVGPGTNTSPTQVYSALFRVTAKDNAGVEAADVSDAPFSIFQPGLALAANPLEPAKATLVAAPTEFALSSAWPNPSKGAVSMNFSVAKSAHVKLNVIDAQGREISTLANGEFAPGRYQARWDGTSDHGRVAAGVYFIRYTTPGKTLVTRVTIAQ